MNFYGQVKTYHKKKGKIFVHFEAEDPEITDNLQHYSTNGVVNAELRLNDSRIIRVDQRKKIYATIRDISEWTGDYPEYLKELMKINYCIESGEEYFSLSSCSVTTAREFITFILDFALKNGVPLQDLAINRTDDIDKYIYMCLKYRKCAITGSSNADIHHVTRVGMGRNRNKVNHAKLKLIPLSREWHNRIHAEGEEEIFKKFNIYGIKADKELLDRLNLRYEDIS